MTDTSRDDALRQIRGRLSELERDVADVQRDVRAVANLHALLEGVARSLTALGNRMEQLSEAVETSNRRIDDVVAAYREMNASE